MRTVALLLLLANVAFLAWAQYAPSIGSAEPQLMAQQMRPEAIKFLSQEEATAVTAIRTKTACTEWGAFNAGDLLRAHQALESLAPAANIAERQVEEAAGHWVFLPPLPSRQAAVTKVAELKRLGVDEYFIVQDDAKLRFAISLGVYRTEEGARARLELLRSKGVRTAVLGVRQTPVRKIYLQLRDSPPELGEKLADLRDDFPGADTRNCE